MKKEKILKNKKLNNVLIFGLVFLLSFCTIGAFYPSFNAPKTANAYSINTDFVNAYDVYDVQGAAGGIFETQYVFDGFQTLAIGAYEDGIPENRTKITDFKQDSDGFKIKQGVSTRFRVNEITTTLHYYSGRVNIVLYNNNLLNEPIVYAVGVFPEGNQSGAVPQIFFAKLEKGEEVQVSFIFPEYKQELENAYGSIVIYKRVGTNKYGNPFPVFENTPKYNELDLTSRQYDAIFYPEQVNRTSVGVLSQKSRPHFIYHSETSAQTIEMTLPAWGVWRWKNDTLNFNNEIDDEELFERPLQYSLSKSFSSGGVAFSAMSVDESAGTVKYDTYTVYSGTPGAFVNPEAKKIYFSETTIDRFFYDDNISYFLTQNFNFYIPKGEDFFNPATPPGFALSATTMVAGLIVGAIGLATGIVPLAIGGGVIAGAGAVTGAIGTIVNPGWWDTLKGLPGEILTSIKQIAKLILEPFLPIIPSPDKPVLANILLTILCVAAIVAIVTTVVVIKRKKDN